MTEKKISDLTPSSTVESDDQIAVSRGAQTLRVPAGMVAPPKTMITTYDANVDAQLNEFIAVNANAGPATVNLPDSTGIVGKQSIIIKKVDSSTNVVTIVPYLGQSIDGESQDSLTFQNESVSLMPNNGIWLVY